MEGILLLVESTPIFEDIGILPVVKAAGDSTKVIKVSQNNKLGDIDRVSVIAIFSCKGEIIEGGI